MVSVCIAIWLSAGLSKEFHNYNDWRKWFSCAMIIFVILYLLYFPFDFIIVYSQITIDARYILMKTPLSMVEIPWDEVLGVKLLHKGKAFRIIGVHRNIIFNAENYADSKYLLELVREKLSPVLNRDLPSVSEEILLDMINLILRNRPGISPLKVHEKVLSVDRKLRYEKVKRLVKSIRNGI
jgi:hypothetical protein